VALLLSIPIPVSILLVQSPSDPTAPPCYSLCQVWLLDKVALRSHASALHAASYCFQCNEVFGSPELLKSHTVKVHPAKTFKCPYCDERFSTASAQDKHVKKAHPLRWVSESLQCVLHGASGELWCEVRSLRSLPFPRGRCMCPFCSKSFGSYKELDSHILQQHLGGPPPR